MKRFSYEEKLARTKNAAAKNLLQIICDKKSNLALSLDVTNSRDMLHLADLVGSEICVLKTHIDIIDDFSPSLINELLRLAKKHRFIIFEDRKFADIGHTVKHQYGNGIFKISEWADIVNAHTLPGPGIIQGLASVGLSKNRGLLLLAEMSSAGNLLDQAYAEKTLAMARAHKDFVIGFITQRALSSDPDFLNLTPGVQISNHGDQMGQQYVTPEMAIEKGADVIIVGRGILQAEDPLLAARQYRKAGWEAYQKILIPS